MTDMEMAGWLQHYLPAITAGSGADTHCWIARMKTRRAEHNPPFYWLGRALDVIAAANEEPTVRARLEALHGPEACAGDDHDDGAQRVLSETCAFAWTSTHLGAPRIEAATEGDSLERDRIRLHVPAHDMYVLPARLSPGSSGGAVLDEIAGQARAATDLLPPARGRLLYLDMWYARQYPQGAGYDLGLTEPVQSALRQSCGEAQLGHAFTRPFQWGNPVEAHY